MRLFIKDNDDIFDIDEINRHSSISRLKYDIYKKYNIDYTDTDFSYNGILLKNNKSIDSYNLTSMSNIIVKKFKIKGGSCKSSNTLSGIFLGLLFFIICVLGFFPILVRVYWLLLMNVFGEAKELLFKYERIGSGIIGAGIGFMIMAGFVHISGNAGMYLWGIPLFMLVFTLIGSRRMVSFFEPMFREKCVYLDPATRTIRKCGLTSPGHIGHIFVYFIKIMMALFRYCFLFLIIFVCTTHLSLFVVKSHEGCDNYCETLALAKKIGSISTYVFIAIYILYNIPNYLLNLITITKGVEAFPFTIINFLLGTVEDKLGRLAHTGKYYIFLLYIFPFPLVGKIFKMIHNLLDLLVDNIEKYTYDFRGYTCTIHPSKLISVGIELTEDIKLNMKNNHVPKKLGNYIEDIDFSSYEYAGKFKKGDLAEPKFIEDLDKLKSEWVDIDGTVENFKSYMSEVSKIMIDKEGDLQTLLNKIPSMNERIEKILTAIPATAELKINLGKDSHYANELDKYKLYDFDKMKWLQYKEGSSTILYLKKTLYCMVLYFISLFNAVLVSYGSAEELKNELKVSNVAGLGCFFAWMVMSAMVATNKMH
jgi:hypothetical protein